MGQEYTKQGRRNALNLNTIVYEHCITKQKTYYNDRVFMSLKLTSSVNQANMTSSCFFLTILSTTTLHCLIYIYYTINTAVSYKKQELLTIREHLGSSPLFFFFLQSPCCSSIQFSVLCSLFCLSLGISSGAKLMLPMLLA